MIVLRNISNIMKHRYLINSDQIVQEDKPGIFQAPFGEVFFTEANYVFFLDGKQCVAVRDAVIKALSYWDSKISALP